MKKLKKFSEICRKLNFAGQCYAEEEKNINYFRFQLSKWHFHFPIWSGKKNLIIFVDMEANYHCVSLYGVKKAGNVLNISFLLKANPLFLYRYEVKEVFSSNG